MNLCRQRLLSEKKQEEKQQQLQKDRNIVLTADPVDIKLWTAVIEGPPDSVYEGFKFRLAITVDDNYPIVPPKISFLTKIFHPNIHYDTGEICLDILKKAWSPVWTLNSACVAITSLMSEPAPDRYG